MSRSTESKRACALLGVIAVATASSCFNPGQGEDPPDNGLYFPVGLAVSDSGKTLFVVNSNFDLRYNAGTLQALDIDQIWGQAKLCIPKIAHVRFDDATKSKVPQDSDRTCANGADVAPFVKTSVRIGAFGADVVATPHYSDSGVRDPPGSFRGRLLIPVRGDATLTIVDYEESTDATPLRKLTCMRNAQFGTLGKTCTSEWRVGGDVTQNSRQLALEGEPFSVAVPGYWPSEMLVPPVSAGAGPTYEAPRNVGGIAAIVHQSSGDVSAFIGTAQIEGQTIPQAKLASSLLGLPPGGTFITPLDLVDDHPFVPRFLVTSRSQANVYVVSFFSDTAAIDRSNLGINQAVLIPTQTGFDSRGAVVDPPEDDESRPIRVFVTNRTPASLVVGLIDPTTRALRFIGNAELPIGPSRVVRARLDVEQPDGTFRKRTRIFATSFDGRFVTMFDPDSGPFGATLDVIKTGKGPYTIAVAPPSGTRGSADYRPALGFVTNFTDSTIQVLDLDSRAGLLDDELEAAGLAGAKALPGTLGPLFGQVIYTVGFVQIPGS